MTSKNTFNNDSLSSVVQCLFNMPYFKKFIVMQTYNKSRGNGFSKEKKVCDILHKLFSSFYNDLRLNSSKVSLKYLT